MSSVPGKFECDSMHVLRFPRGSDFKSWLLKNLRIHNIDYYDIDTQCDHYDIQIGEYHIMNDWKHFHKDLIDYTNKILSLFGFHIIYYFKNGYYLLLWTDRRRTGLLDEPTKWFHQTWLNELAHNASQTKKEIKILKFIWMWICLVYFSDLIITKRKWIENNLDIAWESSPRIYDNICEDQVYSEIFTNIKEEIEK